MIRNIRLEDIPPIASLDDRAHSWKYHALQALDEACYQDLHGYVDEVRSARQFVVDRANETDGPRRWELAISDQDEVVGMAGVALPSSHDQDKAVAQLCVHPGVRRRGVGTALLQWCEDQAADAGRNQMVVEAIYGAREDLPPYLRTQRQSQAPASAAYVGFLASSGYELAHAARRSVLELPVDQDTMDTLLADALAHAWGYRLHSWRCGIPEEWIEPYARLREAFSRDAPSGMVEWEKEVWDRHKVLRQVKDLNDQGLVSLIAATEHVATGELVGYTELRWPQAVPFDGSVQWITIVLGAHRGHRLGMWMKLANLSAMAQERPDICRVHTDNAQINAPMLDINVAMGFYPAGGIATMRKFF
ncbi:MAG: GNAT family N-acetyltransferase [Propionibacteriaceae bacterium]|nr:GNAT family N-acetyltransferase [Propionibacteriaceae bacterium]